MWTAIGVILACLILIAFGVWLGVWAVNKKGWFVRKASSLAQTAGDLASKGVETIEDLTKKV